MSDPQLERLIQYVRQLKNGGTVTGLTKQEALDVKDAFEDKYAKSGERSPQVHLAPQIAETGEDEPKGWKVVRSDLG